MVVYAHGQFLSNKQDQVLFEFNTLHETIKQAGHIISIGLWNQTAVYLLILNEQTQVLADTYWQLLRPLMLKTDPVTFNMLGYASQIASWFIDHKYCGRCGEQMQRENTEHRMSCPSCQHSAYPRLNPCMIILVTKGDKILLARSPRFVTNMYSTLAGFVEAGESVEDCVHREVFEEVGVTINNLRYIGSQNWPYPYSLMLGFHAEFVAGEINPQQGEIEDAQWFSINDLPSLPPPQAISRYLIDLYISERLGTTKPVFPN